MVSCGSQSVLPEKEGVKVSREEPSNKCKLIGKVSGNTLSTTPKREDVLEDLRQDAANKGANYVVVKEYSDSGAAVTGMAYQCP